MSPRAALYHTNLEFEGTGTLYLRERLPPPKGSEYFGTGDLLSVEPEDIALEIGHCTNPEMREVPGYFIELSAHNQQDPETGRVLVAHPTRDQMVRQPDA
jgi:hypothetical protein